jgi:hypothetical protein
MPAPFAIFGMLLSCLAVSGIIQHVLLFVICHTPPYCTEYSLEWEALFIPYQLLNGFGLFWQMTGVGPLVGTGWAGQPPFVLTSPEIMLKGLLKGDDKFTALRPIGSVQNLPKNLLDVFTTTMFAQDKEYVCWE